MLRKILFLVGCIGTRSLLTGLSTNINLLPYIAIITLLISIGFLYIYIFGNEKADAQLEWTGDKKIWWNQLRLVHGLLYLLFSILAFKQNSYAWIVLGIDTFIGLFVWILHTYYNMNFN
jgi:hypothetical protein